MNKKYDYIVYIGRFSPFHDGHFETLKKACEYAENVILVIGSANAAPTPKNPWSAEIREKLIRIGLTSTSILNNIYTIYAEDRKYHENKWIQYIQSRVSDIAKNKTVAIIGHEKDSTSYYLKKNFPHWDFVETGPYSKSDNGKVVSATKIRELMFEGHVGYTQSNLSLGVYRYLEQYVNTPEFALLQGEYNHILNEEKLIEHLPHGTNFITADSVVVQSGHILLVKRGEYPGKGLWAIPGVHVDHDETIQNASIRALLDETHLKVPEKALRGSLVKMHLFDHPDRSLRARLTQHNARTVTLAYYYELDSSTPIPKTVKGGNGIEKAWWFTFAEVYNMRSELFEDHADIIDYFVS